MIEKINIQSNGVFDYKTFYSKCLVDLDQDIEVPPIALGIGYHEFKGQSHLNPTFTYGEMSAIVAPQKSKKTFFKCVLEACYIGGEAQNYFPSIVTCRTDEKYIMSFDTEQGDYYAHRTFRTVDRMSNVPYKNYLCFKLKGLTDEEMVEFIDSVINDPRYKGKIGWVTIDGIADLCTNTNDLVRSKEIIKKLESYTSQGIHLCGVIHKTFEKDKATGHLGTFVQKKSETVIFLSDTDKDTINSPIKIDQKDSRGAPFMDFYFDLDTSVMIPRETEKPTW